MNMLENFFKTIDKDKPSPSEPGGDTTLVEDSVTLAASPSSSPQPQKSLKRTFDDMEGLYSSDTLDITVGSASQPQTFKSHRNLLACKSEYFRRQLEDNSSKLSFSFDDEDPEIYERVQQWFYSGRIFLPSDETETDASQSLTQNTPSPIPQHKIKSRKRKMRDDDDESIDAFNDKNGKSTHGSPIFKESVASEDKSAFPLDFLTLTKLYALAKRLEVVDLCLETLDMLRQGLENDKKMLGSILIYAFKRCPDLDSLLRQTLTRFAAEAASMGELLEQLGPDCLEPKLMFELMSQLLVQIQGLRSDAVGDDLSV